MNQKAHPPEQKKAQTTEELKDEKRWLSKTFKDLMNRMKTSQ